MKNKFYLVLCLMGLFVLVSCSKDDDAPYPALITEMVMATSDAQGVLSTFTTDDGHAYKVANTVKGADPNICRRFMCGYVKDDETTAHIYTLVYVPLLVDCTDINTRPHDPTGLVSVWKSSKYINFHLSPKTKGDKQAWGFARDSAIVNDAGGTSYYLSLCHHQMKDELAYSTDLFVCLDLDSVAIQRQPEDSLYFRLNTFAGWRTYAFPAE